MKKLIIKFLISICVGNIGLFSVSDLCQAKAVSKENKIENNQISTISWESHAVKKLIERMIKDRHGVIRDVTKIMGRRDGKVFEHYYDEILDAIRPLEHEENATLNWIFDIVKRILMNHRIRRSTATRIALAIKEAAKMII